MSKFTAGAGVVVLGIGLMIGWWQAMDGSQQPVTPALSPQKGERQESLPSKPRTWQPLFNQRDLDGWAHLGGGRCTVQDGVLVLENDPSRRPGYLVSRVTARDFIARLRCRVVQGDSGFFFRSQRHPRTPTEIMGPQVQLNIEPDRGLGGIFEQHGRGWVCKSPPALNAELLQELDWIEAEVTARGEHVTVSINGRPTVDFVDASHANAFREAGCFALQIHGGGFCKVLYQEITVLILD